MIFELNSGFSSSIAVSDKFLNFCIEVNASERKRRRDRENMSQEERKGKQVYFESSGTSCNSGGGRVTQSRSRKYDVMHLLMLLYC